MEVLGKFEIPSWLRPSILHRTLSTKKKKIQYPLGNDHISHQTRKGKPSTQKYLKGRRYVIVPRSILDTHGYISY